MADIEEPGNRYWSLIEPVWLPLNRSWDDGPDGFLRQFRIVRPEAGYLYAAHWCQSEVRNGGLHQFFTNSTGILAPEAFEGFRAIGLDVWASILGEAVQFFGLPYPRECEERCKHLPSSGGRKRIEWDPFWSMDERFYEWLHAGPDRWTIAADEYASRFMA
jgi:hypothetical protein